jgi:hypothetical protein
MADSSKRYDGLLPNINLDELKKISVLFGGGNKMRKDECIAYIRSTLADSSKLGHTLARASRHERAGLALMKILGGEADLMAVALAVRVTGTVSAGSVSGNAYRANEIERSLITRGVVLAKPGQYYSSYSYSSDTVDVFTDERILEQAPRMEYSPLPLDVVEQPANSSFRSAQRVFLDVFSLLRAIEETGGIGLTQKYELRVNDVRKLTKKMGWGQESAFDGMVFSNPAAAFTIALTRSRILKHFEGALDVAQPMEEIAALPASDVLLHLVQGILRSTDWLELEPEYGRYRYEQYCRSARLAIFAGLCCLPDRCAWYCFRDFERAIFERVGKVFSIDGVRSEPYTERMTTPQKTGAIQQWQDSILATWQKVDVPWLHAAFQSWLYAFGVVELSLTDGKVDRFRLTDAARAILYGEPSNEPSPVSEQTYPAWIVQPNFDVVVYIGACKPTQIAFLQQYTERGSVSQHTAQYRITRESVYASLQQGGGVEELIRRLAAGSRAPLPSNVVSEIRTWAGLTERIKIDRRADLLEFANSDERQSAIDRGVDGLLVGDRFVLLRDIGKVTHIADTFPRTIDYAKQPGLKSVTVSEDGVITSPNEQSDLTTRAVLDLWASRQSDVQWRLTRESVAAAVHDGRSVQDLISFLRVCAAGPMPALLEVALRTWSGTPLRGGLGEVVVFRSSNPELLHGLLASAEIQPYVVGRLGHDRVMVKKGPGCDKLNALLEWVGVAVGNSE